MIYGICVQFFSVCNYAYFIVKQTVQQLAKTDR